MVENDKREQSDKEPLRPSTRSASRTLLFVFLLLIFLGSIVQVMHFEIGMLITMWVIILMPALWYLRRYNVDLETFARIKPLEKRFIPIITVLVVSAWILSMLGASLLVGLLMYFGFEPLEIIPPPESIGQLLRYFFVLGISAGICEEVLFRGAIMPSFELQGTPLSALIFSTFLFALFHVSFTNIISVLFLGLMIGLVVIKTGSLWAGIYYHILNNVIASIYLYLAANYGLPQMLDSYLVLLMIVLLALMGLLYGLRKLQQQSAVEPLLENRKEWLPPKWLNGATALIMLLFLMVASIELLIGFGIL